MEKTLKQIIREEIDKLTENTELVNEVRIFDGIEVCWKWSAEKFGKTNTVNARGVVESHTNMYAKVRTRNYGPMQEAPGTLKTVSISKLYDERTGKKVLSESDYDEKVTKIRRQRELDNARYGD